MCMYAGAYQWELCERHCQLYRRRGQHQYAVVIMYDGTVQVQRVIRPRRRRRCVQTIRTIRAIRAITRMNINKGYQGYQGYQGV